MLWRSTFSIASLPAARSSILFSFKYVTVFLRQRNKWMFPINNNNTRKVLQSNLTLISPKLSTKYLSEIKTKCCRLIKDPKSSIIVVDSVLKYASEYITQYLSGDRKMLWELWAFPQNKGRFRNILLMFVFLPKRQLHVKS